MKHLFSLKEVAEITDRDFQQILRELSMEEVVKFYLVADSGLKLKINNNMSEKAADFMKAAVEKTDETSASVLEENTKGILKIANKILKTKPLRIALASDHAAFELKEDIKPFLKGFYLKDFGTNSPDSMDYPSTGFTAAESVASGEFDYGIFLCGSGIGMSIVANKVIGIRAALCHCTDFALLSRKHNNANVLVMPGRFISKYLAKEMIEIFLNTPFEGGRHESRIELINIYEDNKNKEVKNEVC